jgi:hypothetical protein
VVRDARRCSHWHNHSAQGADKGDGDNMKDIPIKSISEDNRSLILSLLIYAIDNPKQDLGLPMMHDDNTIRLLVPGPAPEVYEKVYLRADGEAVLFWCPLMDQHSGQGPVLRIEQQMLHPKRYSSFEELKAYEFEPI